MSSPRREVVKVKRFLATLPYALGKVQAGVRLVGAAISSSALESQAHGRSHPTKSLDEMNPADAYRAEDSLALNLEGEADQFSRADEQTFNEILWGAVKGTELAMPEPINSFRTVATDPIQSVLLLCGRRVAFPSSFGPVALSYRPFALLRTLPS